MRPSDLGASGRRDLVGYLARSSMALSGLDLWIPVEAFLDHARIERAVDTTIEAIDLAADLHRCPVSLLLPDPGDGQVDAAIELIKARAMQQGVQLADHRIGAEGDDAVHGLGIDPASILAAGGDPASEVFVVGHRLSSARLSDLSAGGTRVAPAAGSDGRLDLVSFKVALALRPWDSFVVADLRQLPDPWIDLKQARDAWDAADAGQGMPKT